MEVEPNLVKKICKKLGIAQKELAKIVGVSDGTVRSWSSKGEMPQNIINHLELIGKYEEEIKFKNKFKELLKLV